MSGLKDQNKEKYILVNPATAPSRPIKLLIEEFITQVETLETSKDILLELFQDGKSVAYYVDCHILSTVVLDLLDYDASLDPDEQEDIKANRSLQSLHKLFAKMQEDAKKGRQFNDIIVEYLPRGMRAEKPLKIFGGQHRANSIEIAAKENIQRYHGFRVYFGLTVNQRNEIAQVSNSNINVPLDLFDKMQETILGPELRNWCRKVGLLSKDFAERKNNEGVITARLARTFVINFFLGKEIKGKIEEKSYTNFIGNDVNKKYLEWTKDQRKTYLDDKELIEAGKVFAKLHKAQMDEVKKDQELSKTAEFKTKALTPSVLSAWSFVAGLLQRDENRLSKFYKLQEKSKGKNPLAVKEMSEFKYQSDIKPESNKPYRGLGTRTDKKERGKLIEIFLLYSLKQQPRLNTALMDLAVTNYFTYLLDESRKKKALKIK